MIPNCSAELVDLFSPLREDADPGESQHFEPRVRVDDGLLLRRAVWFCHRRHVQCLRATSPLLRLSIEVLLLVIVLAQISCLVVLHSVLPSAISQHASDPLALALTSAVWPGGRRNASDATANQSIAELLTVEVALPSRSCSPDLACGSVLCDFAAERAILELPADVRQRLRTGGQDGVASVHMNATKLGLRPILLAAPFARSAVVRHILGALVAGPLREEVLRREPFIIMPNTSEDGKVADEANSSASNSKVRVTMVEKWSLLAWGYAEFGGASNSSIKSGSNGLSYLSCEGQHPVSLHALRRMAELLDRRMEWLLFKTVWALSTGVFGLLAAAMLCYAVRTSLLGGFKVTMLLTHSSGGFLDVVEAVVMVLSPAGVGVALCRCMGDMALDTAALLACLGLGEVAAFFALHTQESRYLFPRIALPAYVADAYYSYFHSFLGFTWLSHGALFFYQAFLFMVLWSHFESLVPLPIFSLEQLGVEVKLRPSQEEQSSLSAVQKLLHEQGILLLGENASYETGVVMSAVISRAVQNLQAPCMVPRLPAPGALDLLYEHEGLELIHPEALGGGAAIHVLFHHAFAGDARCGAMLAQLTERMRLAVKRWSALARLQLHVERMQEQEQTEETCEELDLRQRTGSVEED